MIQGIKDVISYIKHHIKKHISKKYRSRYVLIRVCDLKATKKHVRKTGLVEKTQQRLNQLSAHEKQAEDFVDTLSPNDQRLFFDCVRILGRPYDFNKYALMLIWKLLRHSPKSEDEK